MRKGIYTVLKLEKIHTEYLPRVGLEPSDRTDSNVLFDTCRFLRDYYLDKGNQISIL